MKKLTLIVLALLAFSVHAQIPLREDTASQEANIGPFLDPADGTALTGLTISAADVLISKAGAASAAKNSGDCTEDDNGMWLCTFDDTDTSTAGSFVVTVCEMTAICVTNKFLVVSQDVYDACCVTASSPVTVADIAAGLFTEDTALNFGDAIEQSVVKEIADGAGTGGFDENDIIDVMVTRMNADPTDFPVNVVEVDETPQTAEDLGALVADVATVQSLLEDVQEAAEAGLVSVRTQILPTTDTDGLLTADSGDADSFIDDELATGFAGDASLVGRYVVQDDGPGCFVTAYNNTTGEVTFTGCTFNPVWSTQPYKIYPANTQE